MPLPELTTDRLILRDLSITDRNTILFLRSDPTVNEYVKRPAPSNLEEAEDFITKIQTGIAEGTTYYWAIVLSEKPEQMIGSICLWNFSADKKTAEVGYDLDPSQQKKGIMNEALNKVIQYGFDTLDLSNIEAFTHGQNAASKTLLEKNNFRLNPNRSDYDNPDNVVYHIPNPNKIFDESSGLTKKSNVTRRQIAKLAKAKIKEGKSRQEVFDELSKELDATEIFIARVVRQIPSLKSREKYRALNMALGIILCLSVAIKVLLASALFILDEYEPLAVGLAGFSIVDLLFAIGVFRFWGAVYNAVAILAIVGVVRSLKYALSGVLDVYTIGAYALEGAIIFLGFFLGVKLVSKHKKVTVEIKSDSGQIISAEKIQFRDDADELDTLDGDL
jgi:ribosomal-protein-alanine N-acetyltransferase